jgi:2-polyprenyl-3-methyl-5-hydroxy-6-metoxy-1,4-benzoquinol methylase
MRGDNLSQALRQAFIELEGAKFNVKRFRENRGRYLKMVEFISTSYPNAKILDIGCGYCYLTKFLNLRGFEVSAVDFFYGQIPEIRCKENNIPFYRLNIELDDLPFAEDAFDVVLLGQVLEHFNDSPFIPLKKIRRVLKNGGILIVTTPNISRLIHLLKLMAGINIYPDFKKFYQTSLYYKGKSLPYRHNRLYSMRELRQLVSEAGFTLVTSGFISEGNYFGKDMIRFFVKLMISPFLLFFPLLRDHLWVVAKKPNAKPSILGTVEGE